MAPAGDAAGAALGARGVACFLLFLAGILVVCFRFLPMATRRRGVAQAEQECAQDETEAGGSQASRLWLAQLHWCCRACQAPVVPSFRPMRLSFTFDASVLKDTSFRRRRLPFAGRVLPRIAHRCTCQPSRCAAGPTACGFARSSPREKQPSTASEQLLKASAAVEAAQHQRGKAPKTTAPSWPPSKESPDARRGGRGDVRPLQDEEEKKKKKAVEEETAKTDSKYANYTYDELLDSVAKIIQEKIPSSARKEAHTMKPPQLMRIGTKKTLWVNYAEICKAMNRSPNTSSSTLWPSSVRMVPSMHATVDYQGQVHAEVHREFAAENTLWST